MVSLSMNGAVLTATADPKHHGDLFRACQGDGGNFGVAISFSFHTRPTPRPVLFTLSWPRAHAAKVVAVWQS